MLCFKFIQIQLNLNSIRGLIWILLILPINVFSQQNDHQAFYRMETYDEVAATEEQKLIYNLIKNNSYLRIESTNGSKVNRIVETEDLQKFYSIRAFRPVWIDFYSNKNTSSLSPFFYKLRELVLESWSHGLLPQDYWNKDIEDQVLVFTESQSSQWIVLEVLLTQAFLKMADDLANGRVNPEIIDNDVKFVKKPFDDQGYLNEILHNKVEEFKSNFLKLAPRHPHYIELQELLVRLNFAKSNAILPQVLPAKIDLHVGSESQTVGLIKKRLNFLGYQIEDLNSQLVTEDLIARLNEYQKDNELSLTNYIPKAGHYFWNLFNLKVDEMILKTEINLEKLRWLPRRYEQRYVWVNTNAAELKVYENDTIVMSFKTINGKSLRRTPMMFDVLTGISLNPTWTATDSIAIQDKLPEIQKDIQYLAKKRMRVIHKKTNLEIDPYTLDWKAKGRDIIGSHFLRMEPGPTNALGVMRFDLSLNNESIYMHDTDDRELFKTANRHYSSGCIRLEKPFEFASYILQGNPEFSMQNLIDLTAKGIEGEVFETNKRIRLSSNERISIYFMPMTVEKNINGKFRFMEDVYFQDRRIGSAILSEGVRDENL